MVIRYIGISLSIVFAGIIIFFSVTGYFFTRLMQRVQQVSDTRMISTARHSQEYLDLFVTQTPGYVDSAEIDVWLARFITGEGFERVVITDTALQVLFSSHILIRRGDDFSCYILEDSLYKDMATLSKPHLTQVKKIGSAYFKALYYPGVINRIPCIIAIEADQNYFLEAARYRTLLLVVFGVLVAVSAGMAALLIIVDRKAEKASKRAAHHEHLAFLGRTSAELAHELKNPLGIMKTALDAYRKRNDPQKTEQALTYLSEEIMHCAAIIDNILSFSRERKLSQIFFSPVTALEKAVYNLTQQFGAVVVNVMLSENLEVRGDPLAFGQIADNLLRNAAQAMQGTGSITILGREIEKEYRILFQDTGPGIDARIARKLFEPFISGSKTGTGLGLAIVKSLCDALRWRVGVVCADPGKTTFEITLKEGMWRNS
jgi:signal transduction histidine kinase